MPLPIPDRDRAIQLDRELALYSDGNLAINWGGHNEKWLRGDGGRWFYLLPNGELYRWSGRGMGGTLVAQLDSLYHQYPRLLYLAYAPAVSRPERLAAAQMARDFGLQFGGSLYFNYGGRQEKWLRGSDNQWYFLLPNGEVYRWNGGSGANGMLVGRVHRAYYENPHWLYEPAAIPPEVVTDDDVVHGGDGDDTLSGGLGLDLLEGGLGNNVLLG